MAWSKLLLVVVLGVVLLALLFVAVIFVNQSGEDFNRGLFDNVKNASVCGLNFVNNDCSLKSVEECPLSEQCVLCEGEDSGNVIYRCELKVCGCGFGMKEVVPESTD